MTRSEHGGSILRQYSQQRSHCRYLDRRTGCVVFQIHDRVDPIEAGRRLDRRIVPIGRQLDGRHVHADVIRPA